MRGGVCAPKIQEIHFFAPYSYILFSPQRYSRLNYTLVSNIEIWQGSVMIPETPHGGMGASARCVWPHVANSSSGFEQARLSSFLAYNYARENIMLRGKICNERNDGNLIAHAPRTTSPRTLDAHTHRRSTATVLTRVVASHATRGWAIRRLRPRWRVTWRGCGSPRTRRPHARGRRWRQRWCIVACVGATAHTAV